MDVLKIAQILYSMTYGKGKFRSVKAIKTQKGSRSMVLFFL
jgi:hypothetical protein